MAELAPRPILIDDDTTGEPLDVRVTITMTASLLKQIEEYRFVNRYRSNSDVIRDLITRGLKASAWRTKAPN
jgi:Arc/MetJ-type ribon-helix-helix transcriptional regulator